MAIQPLVRTAGARCTAHGIASDRIHQGPIPIDDALHTARQICDALEYAHERGIGARTFWSLAARCTKY